MKTKKGPWIPTLKPLLGAVAFLFCAFTERETSFPAVATKDKMNGVNFVSPLWPTQKDMIFPLQRIGANWVALTPFAFMKPGHTTVEYDVQRNWWGDTPAGLRHNARCARKNRLKILLKPHFWVTDQGWPGDFDLPSDAWPVWEQNYEAFILQMARLAEAQQIEMFCIGTEFKIAVRKRKVFWEGLIAKVRKVYSGKLTYASNWDNYKHVPFWSDLDYMGVNAYFPLQNDSTPDVEVMLKKWQPWVKQMKNVSEQTGKPIIFTEFGYRSIHKAAWKQWEVEGVSSHKDVNLEAQNQAYEALFRAVWKQPWLAGGFLWKWWPEDARAGGTDHSNYTPQHKPVEKIIRKWYQSKSSG